MCAPFGSFLVLKLKLGGRRKEEWQAGGDLNGRGCCFASFFFSGGFPSDRRLFFSHLLATAEGEGKEEEEEEEEGGAWYSFLNSTIARPSGRTSTTYGMRTQPPSGGMRTAIGNPG